MINDDFYLDVNDLHRIGLRNLKNRGDLIGNPRFYLKPKLSNDWGKKDVEKNDCLRHGFSSQFSVS